MSDPKRYELEGRTFRHEPLSWMQEKWLAEFVFVGVDLGKLDATALMTMLQAHAPKLLAICLLEEGQTRGQKGEAGFEAVKQLEHWLRCYVTPEQMKDIAYDFFTANPPANLWLLADFQRMDLSRLLTTPSGSATASVSSAAATSPNAGASN